MKFIAASCLLPLYFVTLSFGQDHAPTVEQCRADQRLWISVLQDGHTFNIAVSKLAAETIKQRRDEMRDCFAVDSENGRDYFALVAAYSNELSGRYRHFIDRHHLMAQFLTEDAAGKR